MSFKTLQARQVLTGGDEPPIPNGGIRIRGSKIVTVGPADDIRERDDEVLDFGDATLLPGLIDCHEHLSGHDRYAIGDPSVVEPDMMFALVGTYHARRLVRIGVTTARIPGAPGHIDLMIRRAIREGYLLGPKMVCAGRVVVMTGGHGSMSGVEVDGPWEARRAARAQLKAGADFVKIIASGGVGITREGELPSQPELSVVEMAAAVEAVHSADRRITAHADGVPGISNALEAGVDCIEHGIYLNADQARFMADNGVAMVPTLSTMQGIYHHGIEYGMPETWIPIAEAILEPHLDSFRHALDAGVHFATGTDGFGDIVDEMIIFTTFGVDNYRAIQSATRDAALVISPYPDFGVLGEGKAADIIAVNGDPLDDLNVLRSVQFVMIDGEVLVSDGSVREE
ncbi:MAG: amidohydrolase family protein [Actinomycetia bacterium]|nr:amidohydrolase family protein [Actinomycetes bacterium]